MVQGGTLAEHVDARAFAPTFCSPSGPLRRIVGVDRGRAGLAFADASVAADSLDVDGGGLWDCGVGPAVGGDVCPPAIARRSLRATQPRGRFCDRAAVRRLLARRFRADLAGWRLGRIAALSRAD